MLRIRSQQVLTESEEDLLEARERVIFNVAVRTGRFRIAAATAAAAAAAAARHKDSGEDAQGDDAEGGTGDGRESGRRDEGGSVAGGSILSWMLGRSAAAAADNRGQVCVGVVTALSAGAKATPRALSVPSLSYLSVVEIDSNGTTVLRTILYY